jgi:hypothetical protein
MNFGKTRRSPDNARSVVRRPIGSLASPKDALAETGARAEIGETQKRNPARACEYSPRLEFKRKGCVCVPKSAVLLGGLPEKNSSMGSCSFAPHSNDWEHQLIDLIRVLAYQEVVVGMLSRLSSRPSRGRTAARSGRRPRWTLRATFPGLL